VGWNDHMDDSELGNLPPEATRNSPGPFDPDDDWLRTAEAELQLMAMREWFFARYCDPSRGTPYNGREGGYLYIHGGPFDPADELPRRFSPLVDEALIQTVVDEMHENVGEDWAPVHWDHEEDYEYDERYALHIVVVSEPLRTLRERLRQLRQVLTLEGAAEAKVLAEKLVFSAAIGALEAFLYETVYFWVDTKPQVLRDLVTKLPIFRDEKITLGDLFARSAGLKDHVKGYLQNLVWHRWRQVGALFREGLGIQLPSTQFFEVALLKRHDIVHRSGLDTQGSPITVTLAELDELFSKVEAFAEEIDSRLESREVAAAFADDPPPPS
jgi:hypothetical protein